MADGTPIEWADATWNPVGGCSPISPGCIHCYAQALAGSRLKHHPLYAGTTSPSRAGHVFNGHLTAQPPDSPVWTWPLRWRGAKQPTLGPGAPSLVFVGDMSDLLHQDRPLGYFMRVLDVAARSRHIVQILTKRADRLAHAIDLWSDLEGEDFAFRDARGPEAVRLAHPSGRGRLFADMLETMGAPPDGCAFPAFDWMGGHLYWPDVVSNVWLGFSAERQAEFDERWAHMRRAARRGWTIFLSYEPALGPLKLPLDFLALGSQAQVIFGGESGRNARPAHPQWARDVRDQCAAARVPFLFKHWGGWRPVPWKLERLAGEAIDAYMARSDAEAATHGISPEGFVRELPHKPWSGERAPDAGPHAGLRRYTKVAAGRRLDGRTHDAFPAFRE